MPDDLRNIEFMQLALDLARSCIQSPDGRPFGAVVVIDNVVSGRGANATVRLCDPTAHAEVMAIRDACSRLQTHHLAHGSLYTSCEPCTLCLAAAMWAGITDIYYASSTMEATRFGFADEEFYRQICLPLKDRKIQFHQLLETQGRPIMEEFQSRRLRDDVRGFVSE